MICAHAHIAYVCVLLKTENFYHAYAAHTCTSSADSVCAGTLKCQCTYKRKALCSCCLSRSVDYLSNFNIGWLSEQPYSLFSHFFISSFFLSIFYLIYFWPTHTLISRSRHIRPPFASVAIAASAIRDIQFSFFSFSLFCFS